MGFGFTWITNEPNELSDAALRATCTAHARPPAWPPTSNMPSRLSRPSRERAAPAPSSARSQCRKTSGLGGGESAPVAASRAFGLRKSAKNSGGSRPG